MKFEKSIDELASELIKSENPELEKAMVIESPIEQPQVQDQNPEQLDNISSVELPEDEEDKKKKEADSKKKIEKSTDELVEELYEELEKGRGPDKSPRKKRSMSPEEEKVRRNLGIKSSDETLKKLEVGKFAPSQKWENQLAESKKKEQSMKKSTDELVEESMVSDILEKGGKRATVGETRVWSGRAYTKQADGKWMPKEGGKKEKKDEGKPQEKQEAPKEKKEKSVLSDEHKEIEKKYKKAFKGHPDYESQVNAHLDDHKKGKHNNPYSVVMGKDGKPKFSVPNFHAKVTGKIGDGAPKSVGHDPFTWSDAKFGATKKLLQDHKKAGKAVEIHTSSDLVGHDDYMKEIPKGSTINFHHGSEHGPSSQRLLKTADKLKAAGYSVKHHGKETNFNFTENKPELGREFKGEEHSMKKSIDVQVEEIFSATYPEVEGIEKSLIQPLNTPNLVNTDSAVQEFVITNVQLNKSEGKWVVPQDPKMEIYKGIQELSNEMIDKMNISIEKKEELKKAKVEFIAQVEADKNEALVKAVSQAIAPIMQINPETKEASFNKEEAKNYLDSIIRLRSYVNPAKGAYDAFQVESSNPKFDLIAQQLFDMISRDAKECKALLAGIRAVEFSVEYVKSIVKAYYKLCQKEA